MFKIVKGSTLTALREQAALLAGMHQELAATQEQAAAAQRAAETAKADADSARAEAEHAQTTLKVIENNRMIGLAALRDAVRDPQRAPSARGLLAVHVMRGWLKDLTAEAAKHGGEIDPGLRMLGTLFGDETDDGTVPVLDSVGSQR